MSFDPTYTLSAEEVSLIEASGLTVDAVRDFWSRFPDQNLDTAIGGSLMEIEAMKKGVETPIAGSTEGNITGEAFSAMASE